MDKHFRISVDSLVEFIVCHWSVIQANLVADDEAWLGFSAYDEVAEVAIVGFDVALSGPEVQTLRESVWYCRMMSRGSTYLLKELAEWDKDLTFFTLGVWRTRIRWYVKPWDSQASCRTGHANDVLQYDVRHLFTPFRSDCLIANSIHLECELNMRSHYNVQLGRPCHHCA